MATYFGFGAAALGVAFFGLPPIRSKTTLVFNDALTEGPRHLRNRRPPWPSFHDPSWASPPLGVGVGVSQVCPLASHQRSCGYQTALDLMIARERAGGSEDDAVRERRFGRLLSNLAGSRLRREVERSDDAHKRDLAAWMICGLTGV
jgi:hypothetical protein